MDRRLLNHCAMAFMFLRVALLIVIIRIPVSKSWHLCPGGGVCPDGDKCCPTGVKGESRCLSGTNITDGDCCVDDPIKGSTGCEAGFICAVNSGYNLGCKKTDTADEDSPDVLPRYHLCKVPDIVLKALYGFSVLGSNDDAEKTEPDPELAYLSTMGSIDSDNPDVIDLHNKVQTLVILIHGSSRNVDDYICCTNSALPADEQDPKNSTIMIVAPWFMSPDDNFVQFENRNLSVLPIRWAEVGPIDHTWRYGADAVNANYSSYAAIDSIVNYVVKDFIRYSSLKRIVVAGHSAGGQLTQRWSLLSNSAGFPVDESYHPRVVTRVIVANPKSYCYLDNRRVDHYGNFKTPSSDAIVICPSYNEWEWGFGDGNDLPTPYKDRAIVEAGGITNVLERYSRRDIVYLSGEMDILLNGECEERIQGINRKERSEHFYKALEEFYGSQVHRHLVVPNVNHNHCLMFQSLQGQLAMFGIFQNISVDKRIL